MLSFADRKLSQITPWQPAQRKCLTSTHLKLDFYISKGSDKHVLLHNRACQALGFSIRWTHVTQVSFASYSQNSIQDHLSWGQVREESIKANTRHAAAPVAVKLTVTVPIHNSKCGYFDWQACLNNQGPFSLPQLRLWTISWSIFWGSAGRTAKMAVARATSLSFTTALACEGRGQVIKGLLMVGLLGK